MSPVRGRHEPQVPDTACRRRNRIDGLVASGRRQAAGRGTFSGGENPAPEPGKTACFGRSYDARHLHDHPRQTVAEMTLLLRVEGLDAKGERVTMNPDRIRYLFALAVKRRGDKAPLMTAGECSGDREAECAVDCDGGAVFIETSADGAGVMVRLREEGIGFGADCDTTRGILHPARRGRPGVRPRACARRGLLVSRPDETCAVTGRGTANPNGVEIGSRP